MYLYSGLNEFNNSNLNAENTKTPIPLPALSPYQKKSFGGGVEFPKSSFSLFSHSAMIIMSGWYESIL